MNVVNSVALMFKQDEGMRKEHVFDDCEGVTFKQRLPNVATESRNYLVASEVAMKGRPDAEDVSRDQFSPYFRIGAY